jgi:hypothetical protein
MSARGRDRLWALAAAAVLIAARLAIAVLLSRVADDLAGPGLDCIDPDEPKVARECRAAD